jgi:predicted nucleotidyltransferase
LSMSSTSRATIDLSACVEVRWLANVVADIAAAKLPNDPILVGAMARDVLLRHAHGIDAGLATEDADFAIAVANWAEFQLVRDRLLVGGAFRPSRRSIHRLEHRQIPWIDLVPFGGIERRDRTIAWPPEGESVMNVLGFQEAGATAVVVRLPDSRQLLTVSLPMMAALKLLAWEDRRDSADDRDAEDLMVILEKYLDAGNLERFPSDAENVLGAEFDYASAGALLAGRDLKELLTTVPNSEADIQESLVRILTRELEPDGNQPLAYAMAGTSGDYALGLIRAFRNGLNKT